MIYKDKVKDQDEEKDVIFGRGISQLIHDIRNPLNIIIGFSSIIQIDESINEEVRVYLKKILQSGMAIEQLLSNIDYFMMDKKDIEETSINIKDEIDLFLKSKVDLISEKQIWFNVENSNLSEDFSIVFSPEIFTRILENLFLFSSKAFRSTNTKEIIVSYNAKGSDFYLLYVDSSDLVNLDGEYFTFNEVLQTKRGLGPKFIEQYVKLYNGTISYNKNRDLQKNLESIGITTDIKNYNGFIIKIPFGN